MSEEIALKITVDADASEMTVGELKQAFKDLNNELANTKAGTQEYNAALVKLGDVKGALKDVKEQIKALDPEERFAAFAKLGSTIASGFAAAQGAVALFGGESEDLNRVLVRVQAAIALASGLQGLAGMAKVINTVRLAMIAFAMSNPFTAIATAVLALGVAIYGLVKAFDDSEKKAADLTKANDDLAASYDRIGKASESAMRKAKAEGASDKELFDLEQERRNKELKNLEDRWLNTSKQLVAGKGDMDKIKEEYGQLLFDIEMKKIEIDVAAKEFSNKVLEEEAASLEKQFEFFEKQAADNEKKAKERLEEAAKLRKEIADKIRDAELMAYSDRKLIEDVEMAEREKGHSDHVDAIIRRKEEEAEELERIQREQEEKEEKLAEFRVMIQTQTFKTIGELANAFAGQNEAGQRRAFAINKAAGIAQATIDTYISATKAYASQVIVNDPSSVIRAKIAAAYSIAQGLARVAIIAKTKFDSSGSGTASSGDSISAPNLNAPAAQQNAFATGQVNVNQNQEGQFTGFGVKAIVVESEMTNVQNRIKSIEERTTF